MAQMIKENAEFFVENLKIDPMLEASLLQSGVLTESDQELVEVRILLGMKSMMWENIWFKNTLPQWN